MIESVVRAAAWWKDVFKYLSLSLSLSLLPNLQMVCESQPPSFCPFPSLLFWSFVSSAVYMGEEREIREQASFPIWECSLGVCYFTLNCEFFSFCCGAKPFALCNVSWLVLLSDFFPYCFFFASSLKKESGVLGIKSSIILYNVSFVWLTSRQKRAFMVLLLLQLPWQLGN